MIRVWILFYSSIRQDHRGKRWCSTSPGRAVSDNRSEDGTWESVLLNTSLMTLIYSEDWKLLPSSLSTSDASQGSVMPIHPSLELWQQGSGCCKLSPDTRCHCCPHRLGGLTHSDFLSHGHHFPSSPHFVTLATSGPIATANLPAHVPLITTMAGLGWRRLQWAYLWDEWVGPCPVASGLWPL